MYVGVKGYRSSLGDFIMDLKKGDEFYVLGTKDDIPQNYKITLQNFFASVKEKGIGVKAIYHQSTKDPKKWYGTLKNIDIKFTNIHNPSSIVISKSKILVIAWDVEGIQVLITSKALANSFLDYFNNLWNISKRKNKR